MPAAPGGASIGADKRNERGDHGIDREGSHRDRAGDRDDEGSCRARLRRAADDRGDADPDPGARRDRGPHRGIRALPHRHPRRPRRVAGQAVAAVHPRPRGRRHRRSHRARRHRGRSRRPRRAAVARLRMRHLRVLRHGLGDALPRAAEHGLLDGRRLRRVREGLRPLRRPGAGRRSTRSTPHPSPARASRPTRP